MLFNLVLLPDRDNKFTRLTIPDFSRVSNASLCNTTFIGVQCITEDIYSEQDTPGSDKLLIFQLSDGQACYWPIFIKFLNS